MQVKCVKLQVPGGLGWDGGCQIEIGGVYEVVDTKHRYSRTYYELDHHRGTMYVSSLFEPYNPYSNSVSRELADKAMNVGDSADQPIKIKEPVPS